MTVLTHAITSALLQLVWQGLLVAILLRITLETLRAVSAQIRYLVSCVALAIMVALPVITVWLVYRSATPINVLATHSVDIPNFVGKATLPVPSTLRLETRALQLWFVGVLVFAVRLMLISRHVVRLKREGDPAEASLMRAVSGMALRMNINRPIRVLISRLTDTPSVAGWLRPVVLLPAATLLSLSSEQLEAVLVHELAHIRRHDYLFNVLQILAETLFFYQPAVWWVSSRIRSEREICCDDLVVRICGDPVDYARALAKLERLRVLSPELEMRSTAGPLLYRIRRLTGETEVQTSSNVPAALALFVALSCLLSNLHSAQSQPQKAEEPAMRRDAIRTDSVRLGEMRTVVRAPGTLNTPGVAQLEVAASQSSVVNTGQSASIELRHDMTIAGTVSRADPITRDGRNLVEIDLQTPASDLVGQPIDGLILVRTLKDVIYVSRPAVFQPNAEGTIFKFESDGAHVKRVKVRFGVSSVTSVQILVGLMPGDQVILNDMTNYCGYDRVRLE
jgi:beta-lactamase regulating signal transducer with metallopeptidase domain